MSNEQTSVIGEGKFVELVRVGSWEYARRKKMSGIVGIVAVTGEGKMLLVEQYRAPVGKRVIEIPAGLAGDVAGQEQEELAEAARRELMEETGYEAGRMEYLTEGAASAGITDEIITLFRATNLVRRGDGGGDGSENIVVHEVAVGEVQRWLAEKRRGGKLVDLKVYAALEFAQG